MGGGGGGSHRTGLARNREGPASASCCHVHSWTWPVPTTYGRNPSNDGGVAGWRRCVGERESKITKHCRHANRRLDFHASLRQPRKVLTTGSRRKAILRFRGQPCILISAPFPCCTINAAHKPHPSVKGGNALKSYGLNLSSNGSQSCTRGPRGHTPVHRLTKASSRQLFRLQNQPLCGACTS